jgi:hypothetical protein
VLIAKQAVEARVDLLIGAALHNATMAQQRYVFYFSMGTGSQAAVRAARKAVSALGATVIKAGVGTLLVEATPAKAAEMAEALPLWRYVQEKTVARLPERGALQRKRLKLAANAAKD